MQPDPDAIDPALGASDPGATVLAEQHDLHTDVQVTTSLPHVILRHRLDLLIACCRAVESEITAARLGATCRTA